MYPNAIYKNEEKMNYTFKHKSFCTNILAVHTIIQAPWWLGTWLTRWLTFQIWGPDLDFHVESPRSQ